MSFKNSGCDLSEPAQVIGRLSHLRDVTQYAVSESPLLRPQTALEERSRPRIIGSHVLVWLGDQNFDVDLPIVGVSFSLVGDHHSLVLPPPGQVFVSLLVLRFAASNFS